MSPAPLLISMPHGLIVGGVTTFVARLANGLCAAGRRATLVVHEEAGGCAPLKVDLHPRVEVVRTPTMRDCTGDLSLFIPAYRDLVRRLCAESGSPVVFAPQMLGDAFGIGAALALTDPESIRVIGWQHSDIEYDARVLSRYEPVIARFVAVSDRIQATLRQRLPHRPGDVANIPYGVECADCDEPTAQAEDAVLKLIYTGRIEHEQKRILALAFLSDELTARGIDHRITAVGDGPAAPEFDGAIASRPTLKRLPACPPGRVRELLARHDAFVLPSRYEGLSVSMLEAMAAGCVPILVRTESGALQAVEPGYNGEVAEVAYEADDREAAGPLADAVARFLSRDRAAMAAAAHQTVRERFSLERHIERVAALIDEAVASPVRAWPADRQCAFTSGAAESSGSVPADGAARLRAVLERLAGRDIVIHGTGRHTLQLGVVLAASPARIVAFTDDDRQRQGGKLWNWPIIAPGAAARTGAKEVVISSWMHEGAIWGRRELYEQQGLTVHRVYSPLYQRGRSSASVHVRSSSPLD